MSATALIPSENELIELGLPAAAAQIKKERELARKLRIAFEHFRVVEPAHIDRFNKELYKKTLKKAASAWGSDTYNRLKFTPIHNYENLPPAEALEKLREAKTLGCFDTFEIATIESVEIVPDPILFGRITGSENRYFIAQWDDDVKIEEILRADEG